MLTVKVKTEFFDKQADLKRRKVGEKFQVDEKRAEYLFTYGYVDIVEKIPKTKKAEKAE